MSSFAYALPWSYPGHARWGHSGSSGWLWHRAPPIGLTHAGVTDAYRPDTVGPTTLDLIAAAPPRMTFAFLPTAAGGQEERHGDLLQDALHTAQTGDRGAARKMLVPADRENPVAAKICRGFIELLWSRGRAKNAFAAFPGLAFEPWWPMRQDPRWGHEDTFMDAWA